MTLNEIAEASHKATTDRGILKQYKTMCGLKKATAEKILEETTEFIYSMPMCEFSKDSEQSEIADIILTISTYAHDCGYDLDRIVSDKLEYNQRRTD